METRKILDFICDEVTRQGHDINSHDDGWPRVVGMAQAWDAAYTHFLDVGHDEITLHDIKRWARIIEPMHNLPGFRNCNVTVGGRLCPNWKDVPSLMEQWHTTCLTVSPDEAYVAFQKIHPFRDGNGRTGKIIHNWLNTSLQDPILIKDYFGGGNP